MSVRRIISSKAKPPVVCRHLGAATGETAAVECVTCGGKRRTVHYAIHSCGALGECLPAYHCTKDALAESMSRPVAVCNGCDYYEPTEH